MFGRIRTCHLSQLVRSAEALPGPELEAPLWRRLQTSATALARDPDQADGTGPARAGELPAPTRREIERLRAATGAALTALARRVEEGLAPALRHARRNWESVDDIALVDRPLEQSLADTRRQLEAALADHQGRGGPAVAAVALEGLLALETARSLVGIAERRMSALIRRRVQVDEDLIPGGRPFLDLGAALEEVARAWT